MNNAYDEFVGQVVTVLTPVGEVVGKLSSVVDGITLTDPRLFVVQGEQAGFLTLQAAVMTAEMSDDTVFLDYGSFILLKPTTEKASQAWRQSVSGIVTASADQIPRKDH